MHKDELSIDEALIGNLIASQFPEWSGLPLVPVSSAGTDNALFRLGKDMVVRLPRMKSAAGQAAKDFKWLPKLAPSLPLAISMPLALGKPTNTLPWNWTVCNWLPGETPNVGDIMDEIRLAISLAEFTRALQKIDSTQGPPPGAHNFGRGVPLVKRDSYVRTALAELHNIIDVEEAAKEWDTALAAATWSKDPVWIHGDLQAGNILLNNERLSAVIDFGGLGVGDPAVDLLPAWNMFGEEARQTYRDTLEVDDDTWARGRGWALSVALIALPYYYNSNPTIVASSLHVIQEVLNTQ